MTRGEPHAPDPSGRAQRLILRGGGAAGLGLLIRLGARLLLVFVAARLFGATLFGAYSVAVAGVELAVAAGGLGTKRILFKLLDDDRTSRPPIHIVLDTALLVLAVSLALAALTICAAALIPAKPSAGGTASALAFIAPMIGGQALTDLFLSATRWKHRMHYEVVSRSIAEPYAGIAATLVAWWLGFVGFGLLIGYWAGTIAALAYALRGAAREFGGLQIGRWRASRAEMSAILAACAVPTLSDLANALFGRLDIYLVGIVLGEAPAGVYGMARQLRTPIRQVRQSFDGLLMPLIAKTIAVDGAAVAAAAAASAARLILSIQLPLLVTAVVIGQSLLGWLGPEFSSGYAALILLALAETVQGAFGVSDLILLYRRPWLALMMTFTNAVVNLVAGILLIAPLGEGGAALAVLLAVMTGAFVRRRILRRAMGVRIPLAHSAGPIVAAAAAILVGLTVAGRFPAGSGFAAHGLAFGAALAVYGLALWLWLRLMRESLRLMNFRTA